MNLNSRAVLALAALAFSPLPQALAADYDPPVYVEEAPEYTPVEVGSGWYLRGDVGYNFSDPQYDFTLLGEEVDNTRINASLGAGYHFNDFLRGDLNFGFVSYDKLNAVSGLSRVDFENNVWNGMANVYADLGTIAGFTPYVGAGVGLIYSSTSLDYSVLPGPVTSSVDDTQYKVAYSLAAGVSYRVSKNTSVDVGYHYLAAPGLEYVDTDTLTTKKGVDYHQVRVGLRYDLW